MNLMKGGFAGKIFQDVLSVAHKMTVKCIMVVSVLWPNTLGQAIDVPSSSDTSVFKNGR